uniref:Uncharacterized protein n=1 Tax=Panagrellus redivivus TaxID=6233 RepID=A0A7E4W7K9_PANRE
MVVHIYQFDRPTSAESVMNPKPVPLMSIVVPEPPYLTQLRELRRCRRHGGDRLASRIDPFYYHSINDPSKCQAFLLAQTVAVLYSETSRQSVSLAPLRMHFDQKPG